MMTSCSRRGSDEKIAIAFIYHGVGKLGIEHLSVRGQTSARRFQCIIRNSNRHIALFIKNNAMFQNSLRRNGFFLKTGEVSFVNCPIFESFIEDPECAGSFCENDNARSSAVYSMNRFKKLFAGSMLPLKKSLEIKILCLIAQNRHGSEFVDRENIIVFKKDFITDQKALLVLQNTGCLKNLLYYSVMNIVDFLLIVTIEAILKVVFGSWQTFEKSSL